MQAGCERVLKRNHIPVFHPLMFILYICELHFIALVMMLHMYVDINGCMWLECWKRDLLCSKRHQPVQPSMLAWQTLATESERRLVWSFHCLLSVRVNCSHKYNWIVAVVEIFVISVHSSVINLCQSFIYIFWRLEQRLLLLLFFLPRENLQLFINYEKVYKLFGSASYCDRSSSIKP